jgi:alcohol dehydrogenase class IV
MAFWKVASAIVMGNTMVLKPATATPVTALLIAEAAQAAGIPPGVLNVIPGPGGSLGKILCTHPDVAKVALTGSTEVGREIMKLASDTVKKVTLELRGKSANIILDDADIDFAVDGAVLGTFHHQGQVCTSGTRVLVSSKIYDEFLDKMKKRTEELRVGYQLLPETHSGPMISSTQLATVDGYVQIGKKEGAEVVTGGNRLDIPGYEKGFYYAPTIFTNVKNSMRIAQEEIFGPVVCIVKFDDDEEAVAIANDSIYGLAGGVFSGNNARAERIARQMRTGTVWINNYHAFGDYCPFGGYKQSGVGRELGIAGLKEYTQIKRIHVNSFAASENTVMLGFLSDRIKTSPGQYDCRTKVIAGHGTINSLCQEVVSLGCKRAFIMTDPCVKEAGLTQLVQDALVDFCVGVFDKIAQDTDLAIVDEATAMARSLGADCIVSVGGGSVIDTGKAVCVVLKSGGKANDHIAINRLAAPQTPHMVVPTTAGTGSEVTDTAVIKSKAAGRKVYIMSPFVVPNVAILDPRFTLSLPKGLTATTGLDAMTHAIEALTSATSQPICDGMALQAIRMIKENLPRAIANGRDEEARSQLQLAATMAGWAFTGAHVGLVHSNGTYAGDDVRCSPRCRLRYHPS